MSYLERLTKGKRVVTDDQKVADQILALQDQLNERGLVLESSIAAMGFHGEIYSIEYKAIKHNAFVKTCLFGHVRKAYELVQVRGMNLWQAADAMGLEHAWEVSHMLRRAKVALGERAFEMGKPTAKPCPICEGNGAKPSREAPVKTAHQGYLAGNSPYPNTRRPLSGGRTPKTTTCRRCDGKGVVNEASFLEGVA